jgi:hypothetical protein
MPHHAESVNGFDRDIPHHLIGQAERPIMGTSEGAAKRQRRRSLTAIASALAKVETDREAALDSAAYEAGRLVGHGANRAEVGDNLYIASKMNGLLAEIGADAVQSAISGGIAAGEHAAAEDIAAEEAAADGIVSRVASSIKPEPVTWIWPQRIPCGKLSILGGHPGEGKTLLSTYMAAVVSTGGKWADGTQAEVGNVVILSAEDDAADTIVPRLMAHGADLSRVHFLDAVRVEGRERMFSLVEDIERLEELLARIGGASLMVVDVIDSYLGNTDSHRNAAVRGVLGPLKDVAARQRLAILGLTHFRKGETDRAVLRFTGSIGFIGQARAGWIVTPEMDAEGSPTERKIFARAKGNNAPDIGGLAYRIEGAEVTGIPTARIEWDDGAIMMDADEALAPQSEEREERQTAMREATEFIETYLGTAWRESKGLIAEAMKAGIKRRTFDRARAKLHCQTMRSNRLWLVALPGVPPLEESPIEE